MTVNINRRRFNAGLSFALTDLRSLSSKASTKPKIVIIGGGAGGATVASSLKRLIPSLNVTLIEQNKEYTSCFFSNTYIGGIFPIKYLTHTYRGLETFGVRLVYQKVKSINILDRTVCLQDENILSFDWLVVAPGIDFIWNSIEGYNEETADSMPHAWRGKKQSMLLRKRIENIENGGTVIITVPKLPYRCPPAPYERACLIANYFSQHKPKSKVVIFDSNFTITKEKPFMEIIKNKYNNYIECYLSNDIDDFSVTRVDPQKNIVFTKSGLHLSGSVINLIPPQKAAAIALNSGLGEDNWCTVDPQNFKSKNSENVYIIGDSSKADQMPKSAYAAFSQGLVVAAAIAAEVRGVQASSSKYKNICWSVLEKDNAIKIESDYVPSSNYSKYHGLQSIHMSVSEVGESPKIRKATYDEAINWYQTLTSTLFNK
ncbi:MAG: FAD/NAD(P)-binding oxidoreductase [Hyphomicrobium sp.]